MTPAPSPAPHRLDAVAALACGICVSLCVTGYTFMQSNHQVYFLDAIKVLRPENLARDWFTTNTLQYHVLYTYLIVALMRIGALWIGCFACYLALVVALHSSWRSIVRSIGGDDRAYLLSVVLYHLSAGGLGLGVYQFLQDGSFLPSNIAGIGALAALAFWLRDRLLPAAFCVGIAGVFHVNYALILSATWAGFATIRIYRVGLPAITRYALAASAIALFPCAANLSMPVWEALSQREKFPIDQFVSLYVELRHPHHFDAAHWPVGLWISYLWPIPFALFALTRLPTSPISRRVRDVLFLALALQLVATLFAGVWFVSETLAKLSLFRFSMFAKLLSCVLTAWLILHAQMNWRRTAAALLSLAGVGLLIAIAFRDRVPASVPTPSIGMLVGAGLASLLASGAILRPLPRGLLAGVGLIGLIISLPLAAQQRLGPAMPGEGDHGMLEVCEWARVQTPSTALFLVPPHDSLFRLYAQRSVVVSFKQVPQLSGELVEWKRRLDDVTGVDVLTLPRPMYATLDSMADTYAARPADALANVATEYDCDYIIAMSDLGPAWRDRLAYVSGDGRYRVYQMMRRIDASTQRSHVP